MSEVTPPDLNYDFIAVCICINGRPRPLIPSLVAVIPAASRWGAATLSSSSPPPAEPSISDEDNARSNHGAFWGDQEMAQINSHLEEFEEDGQHLPSPEDDDEMEMDSAETCF